MEVGDSLQLRGLLPSALYDASGKGVSFTLRNIKLLRPAKIIDRIKTLMKPPLYLFRSIIFRLE